MMDKKKFIEFLQWFTLIFGCAFGSFGALIGFVELTTRHPLIGLLVLGAALSAAAAWFVVTD